MAKKTTVGANNDMADKPPPGNEKPKGQATPAAGAQPEVVGQPEAPPPPAKIYDLWQNDEVIDLIATEDDERIRKEVGKHVSAILAKHGLSAYNTLLLYDNCDAIAQFHADQIYEAASAEPERDILLIIQSAGGRIEPAYLISKTCSRLAKEKFVVAVPRRAKSAATLISLGADEIHMGLMSELGPVDPQIEGYPALGLISSLSVVAEAAAKYPDAAEMFARYLSRKLDLRHLGYFVRVPESAVQYGERLLKRNERKLPRGATAHSVADQLVNHYKDHSFVIDVDEASQLLGAIVRRNTAEYAAANDVYKFLHWYEFILGVVKKKDMWCVGSAIEGGAMRDRKKSGA